MTIDEARSYFIDCNERIISVAKDENIYNYKTQQVEDVFMRRTFEANELAIKALEQEPCDKCVYSTSEGCQYDDITETIPPFETSDDAISRQAVLDKISAEIEEIQTYDGLYIDRAYVLQIIDKYKAEGSEKE